jgi:hypothetical protein
MITFNNASRAILAGMVDTVSVKEKPDIEIPFNPDHLPVLFQSASEGDEMNLEGLRVIALVVGAIVYARDDFRSLIAAMVVNADIAANLGLDLTEELPEVSIDVIHDMIFDLCAAAEAGNLPKQTSQTAH